MPTKNELDDFWNIEKLIPKRKSFNGGSNPTETAESAAKAPGFATEIKCTEISFGEKGTDRSDEAKLSFSSMNVSSERPQDTEYSPENNKFIKSIKIIHLLDRYDFYGNFRKAALIYFDYKTDPCDYVPFYSYMPQYSQMSLQQRNYYFYWRNEFKNGRYLNADYSHICLFAFEILNLTDKIPPKQGVRFLCEAWSNYRKGFPRMDTDFGTWIQDYCLVHGLDAPYELLQGFISDVITLSPFKEFWFSNRALNEREQRNLFLTALSEYDWKKGKYAAGATRAFYEKHMLGAMGCVISDVWYGNDILRSISGTKKIRRTAFPSSICTHSVKCNLEIEYYPLSESTLREKITQAVRYSENKLRALMGIKSRLAIKDMDVYYSHIIDKYFESVYKAESEKRRAAMLPEYEKLYDAPSDEMSLAGAVRIEESSWTTTARLVAEDPDCTQISHPDTDKTNENIKNTNREALSPTGANTENDSSETDISDDEMKFLLLCLNGGEVASTLENDRMSENINELFLEKLGDVVIELTDSGYAIIEDYREDIERILKHA